MGARRTAILALAFVTLMAGLLVAPQTAEAKDLRGRFGLGIGARLSPTGIISGKITLPSSSPTRNVQIQALVGFALSESQRDRFSAGARVLIPVLAEDNLNVYGAVGGSYVFYGQEGHAVRADAGAGIEFFLFGLENLGLTGELGLVVDFIGEEPVPPRLQPFAFVGLHYYF